MDGAVVLVIVVAIAGVAISASKSKKKAEAPRYTSPLNDPNYRWKGDRGSSGNPDFTHSSNCECFMCLYGHNPRDRACKCKVCADPASFYGR